MLRPNCTVASLQSGGHILRNRIALALMFLFYSLAQAAHAFLGPPYITPEHPVAGETISVNIYEGECDGIVGGIPGYPQVTQEGSAIRALFYSVHYQDPELCFLPVGTATFPISNYLAGSYTLQVDRWYFDGGGNPVVETLGILPFTVTGGDAPTVSVPVLQQSGLWVLILTIVGIAMAAAARRTRLTM
jgi:hypothetical protein